MTLALAALAIVVTARAAPQPLPDAELRQFQGAMGVPGLAAARLALPAVVALPVPDGTWQLDGTGARLLTAAQFQAAMADAGIVGLGTTPASAQPVFELPLTVKSANFSMPASQLLAPLGLAPNLPGLGTLRVLDMNTTGTRVWIWPK